MNPRIIGVIPARYAAKRLPGKPLLRLAGKPMVQHVYERAIQADLHEVIVATDDVRIYDAVRDFGGRVVMTRGDHPSGTDRVAEAVRELEVDLVVNLQGDEPLLDPDSINRAVVPLREDESVVMSTLAHRIHGLDEIMDPNVVKVVCDGYGRALYFSRAPIPYSREGDQTTRGVLRHIGLYVFRKEFLQIFSSLPPTALEKSESLEQLRALEHGYHIAVVETDTAVVGVDTAADFDKVREILEGGRGR